MVVSERWIGKNRPRVLPCSLHGGTQENHGTPQDVRCPSRDLNKVPLEHNQNRDRPSLFVRLTYLVPGSKMRLYSFITHFFMAWCLSLRVTLGLRLSNVFRMVIWIYLPRFLNKKHSMKIGNKLCAFLIWTLGFELFSFRIRPTMKEPAGPFGYQAWYALETNWTCSRREKLHPLQRIEPRLSNP